MSSITDRGTRPQPGRLAKRTGFIGLSPVPICRDVISSIEHAPEALVGAKWKSMIAETPPPGCSFN
jgi:hypothetical protein